MSNYYRIAIIGFSILVLELVTFSHSRYFPWLTSQASTVSNPAQYLYYLALHGNNDDLENLSQWAIATNDKYWITVAASMFSPSSLYALAMSQDDVKQQKTLLMQAANLGHTASQFELSIIADTPNSKLYWLKAAAEAEFPAAIIGLYQWYLMRNDVQQALPLLTKAAEFDAQSAVKLAKLKWQEQQYNEAIIDFERASTLGGIKANQYLSTINQYWKRSENSVPRLMTSAPQEQCAMTIQPLSISLDATVKAVDFIRMFTNDDRLQSLPICINEPMWLSEEILVCDGNWQNSGRLGCDIASLSPMLKDIDFSHLAVFATLGKANVNNGVMYLDLADNYSVFVHELAHFAGFVDEYPLNSNLAKLHCDIGNAPNIVIEPAVVDTFDVETIEESPLQQQQAASVPHSSLDLSKWTEFNLPISISKARTCNNHNLQAFKPTAKITFMEYHDEGIIPPLYIALWRQQLANRQNLTPASVNFNQQFSRQGDQYWSQFWSEKQQQFYAPQ